MRKNLRGFTVIELLVVIVVLVLLATIATTAYVNSQASARDTKRKSDLAAIAEAIQLYRQKYGNDVTTSTLVNKAPDNLTTPSQCGSNGSGWFNYATGSNGAAYEYSGLNCLQAAGYLDSGGTFADPSGCSTNGSSAGLGGTCRKFGGTYGAYMKYSYGSGDTSVTCLYARLETEDYSSTMTSTSPCSVTPTLSNQTGSYKMNYMVVVN